MNSPWTAGRSFGALLTGRIISNFFVTDRIKVPREKMEDKVAVAMFQDLDLVTAKRGGDGRKLTAGHTPFGECI